MISSSLPIIHFSIVVRRPAIVRSFPGGAEEFDRVFPNARASDDLSVHVSMSLADVNFILDRMSASGLIPGQDVAVVHWPNGLLLGCPGVALRYEGGELGLPDLTVSATNDAGEGPSF